MKLGLDRLLRSTPKKVAAEPPPHLAYDRFSMLIDGKRSVIRGGAFHYFRLPSPELWKERLLTIKRAGYNTVDLYFNWGFHSAAKGVYDFEGVRDVSRLMSLCEDVGLYVIARPGPFINSEVDGGGHPAWLLQEPDVHLRCLENGDYVDSPKYREYARQWYEQIVPRILGHANVILFQIENEYGKPGMNPGYMQYLRDLARELGVTVPLIHNDLWKQGCWADLVDIYGVDDYAVSSFSKDWHGDAALLAGLDGLAAMKERYADNTPLAIFELQGGWFDPWDGMGYDEVRRRLGPENMNLVTWSAIAQGATIYSHYMFTGGTNWDHVGAPPVHTSYDFAAPVTEWGGLSQRYHAAKAIAMLVETYEDMFAASKPVDDVQASDPELLYMARCREDGYIIFLRNLSGETRTTTLRAGATETGPVSVGPWDMRVAFINLPFVDGGVTTSCNVLTAMHQGNQHLLVFYGAGRVDWTLPSSCRMLRDEAPTTVDGRAVSTTYDGQGWKDVVFSSGGHRYRSLFLPNAEEAWRVGDYLLLGPSYAGDAQQKGGVTDLARYVMQVRTSGPKEKTIRIYSVSFMGRAEVNDGMILASEDSIGGYLRFDMPRPPEVTLPALGGWRMQGAMETGKPLAAAQWHALAAGASLEMDKLGIQQGFAWYRGVYTGAMRSIDLAIRHNGAVYLNGKFVARLDNYQSESNDSTPESAQVAPVHVDLPGALQSNGVNIVTVLVESLGHNKGFLGNERLARGILDVKTDRPLVWSVRAGIAGESEATKDDFDDGAWETVANLGEGPADDVIWARTHLALDLPAHCFAPIGLFFDGVADKAQIYLNGVLIARDWSICKHRQFYLPEGLLNLHGENTLAILLWRRGGKPAAGTVELRTYTVEASNTVSVL
jgi:hypothetical protein